MWPVHPPASGSDWAQIDSQKQLMVISLFLPLYIQVLHHTGWLLPLMLVSREAARGVDLAKMSFASTFSVNTV